SGSGCVITSSPSRSSATPEPAAATVPAASVPSAIGAGPPTRQLPILTSSSQLPMPAAATSIRTSPAAGGATSSTSRISTGSPSAVIPAARILSAHVNGVGHTLRRDCPVSGTSGVVDIRPDRSARPGMPGWPAPTLRKDAEFIEGSVQLLRVPVDAKGSGADQLVPSVAAAPQPDAQHPPPSCGEQVPYSVPNDVALHGRDSEAIGAREEKVWLGFCTLDVASLDDNRLVANAESFE